MNSATPHDIITALQGARNLNAAVKQCLKREVQKGTPAEKFLKQLKTFLVSERWDAAETFIEKKLETFEPYLQLLTQQAYAGAIDIISDKIIEIYAEKFNATYERKESGVEVQDSTLFQKIVREVDSSLDDELKHQDLPPSPYMKQVLYSAVFEEDVLKEARPFLNGAATAHTKKTNENVN